jgi:glucosamine-6-phosphate deaminase
MTEVGFAVHRCLTSDTLAAASAHWVAERIKEVVRTRGEARIVVATGASQFGVLRALCDAGSNAGVPWEKVTAFHLDEYVGLGRDHRASFRGYLEERFVSAVGGATLVSPAIIGGAAATSEAPAANDKRKLKAMHFLDGLAADPEVECQRYSALLREGDIDLVLCGIGENGHLAFNDPPVADFWDPLDVKVVPLDAGCRLQQLGEGWFDSLSEVPTHAFSMTIPAILRARAISCAVPDTRKAEAVRKAVEGPIVARMCPSSALRTHRECHLWLDRDSSSLLTAAPAFHGTHPSAFPGFVDLQVNGAGGVDFSSPSLTVDDARRAFRLILSAGCAAFCPTIVSSPFSAYQAVLPVLAEAASAPEFSERVLGIHLEGPFLSAKPGARGCHDADTVAGWCEGGGADAMLGRWAELFALGAEDGPGAIRLMTVAADIPGIEQVAADAVKRGIRVLAGHHTATASDMQLLGENGAIGLTHIGNGIPPDGNDRHENPLLASLGTAGRSGFQYATVIADGVHLPDHVLRVIRRCFEPGCVLVSDANPWVGADKANIRSVPFAGMRVSWHEADGSIRETETGGLAGSGASLLQCANYALQAGFADSPSHVVEMAYTRPLRLLGRNPAALEAHWMADSSPRWPGVAFAAGTGRRGSLPTELNDETMPVGKFRVLEQPGESGQSTADDQLAERDLGGVVAITGANGFIASHLIAQLLLRDDVTQIRGSVRNLSDQRVAHLRALPRSKGRLELIDCPDLFDQSALERVFTGAGTVFHTACPVVFREFKEGEAEQELIEPAKRGTETVMRAVHAVGGVTRVVVTGSLAGILDITLLEDENRKFDECDWNMTSSVTNGPYRYAKRLAEETAFELGNLEGRSVEVVTVCPSMTIGPSLDAERKPLNFSLQQIANVLGAAGDSPFHKPGGLGFVDVRDVAASHLRAGVVEAAAGRRYLCSADNWRWDDVARELFSLAGKSQTIGSAESASVNHDAQAGADLVPNLSNVRIVQELGMQFIPVVDSLRDTLAFLQVHHGV